MMTAESMLSKRPLLRVFFSTCLCPSFISLAQHGAFFRPLHVETVNFLAAGFLGTESEKTLVTLKTTVGTSFGIS